MMRLEIFWNATLDTAAVDLEVYPDFTITETSADACDNLRTGTDCDFVCTDDDDCGAVAGCSTCWWKEDVDADDANDVTSTADNPTVMCLECANTVDTDEPQFISIAWGWDDYWKTSEVCTTNIYEAPVDDIYGICSETVTYSGCKSYGGPETGYMDIAADDCKEDIREKVEDYMRPLGITALVVCVFFIGIMYFTQLAIDIWKAGGDDEDDDDDE